MLSSGQLDIAMGCEYSSSDTIAFVGGAAVAASYDRHNAGTRPGVSSLCALRRKRGRRVSSRFGPITDPSLPAGWSVVRKPQA